jgi:hypothetical protein
LPARAFDWRLADHRKHARSTFGMTALAIRVPTTPHLLARLGEIKSYLPVRAAFPDHVRA